MPLFRRRRPLLRAAAVGGGAYALGKHRERRQEEEEQRAYDDGRQAAASRAPAVAISRGITHEDTQRLAELGKLHEQGVLTDDEFARQKTTILSSS